MRNWNQTSVARPAWGHKVFSLPMRNWNDIIIGIILFGQPVFSLPMRNWNRRHSFRWRWKICFQPTYEELKRYYIWRLCLWRKFSAYLWGIETEVIKGQVKVKIKVFSLPMRNWNTQKPLRLRASVLSVFSLPMRNWNIKKVPNLRPTPTCFQPTYEELKLISASHISWLKFVFSLPMRNWNN